MIILLQFEEIVAVIVPYPTRKPPLQDVVKVLPDPLVTVNKLVGLAVQLTVHPDGKLFTMNVAPEEQTNVGPFIVGKTK